jgi:hypothetical protein
MLKGIEIDQTEAEREIVRSHQHFVNALMLNKQTWPSLECTNTISTRAETKRTNSSRPPVYKSMTQRQQEFDQAIQKEEYEKMPLQYK